MIIGIVPTIREPYKNQIEFSVDLKLLSFLRQIKKNIKFIILCEKRKYHFDFLCLAGGNDVEDNSKKSIFRKKLDEYFYSKAKKSQIPILGICHGAQFIIKKEGGKLMYKKGKIKDHKIYSKKINYLNSKVNSYHNILIKRAPSNCEPLCFDKEKNIECFVIKNKKILGVIWHPERNKTFKKLDFKLIKDFL